MGSSSKSVGLPIFLKRCEGELVFVLDGLVVVVVDVDLYKLEANVNELVAWVCEAVFVFSDFLGDVSLMDWGVCEEDDDDEGVTVDFEGVKENA